MRCAASASPTSSSTSRVGATPRSGRPRRGRPIRPGEGRPAAVHFLEDITGRKTAEKQLREQKAVSSILADTVRRTLRLYVNGSEQDLAVDADIRANLPPDLRAGGLVLAPMQRAVVPTGLSVAIPEGFEAYFAADELLAAALKDCWIVECGLDPFLVVDGGTMLIGISKTTGDILYAGILSVA